MAGRSAGARTPDPLIYDAVWNTGKVGVDTICHSIIDLINSRADKKRKLIQHV